MTKLDSALSKVEHEVAELQRQCARHSPEALERQQRHQALSDSVLMVLVRVSEWLLALDGDETALQDWHLQWSWLGLPDVPGQVPPLTKQQRSAMMTAIEDYSIGVPPVSGEQLLGRLRAVVPGMPAEGTL